MAVVQQRFVPTAPTIAPKSLFRMTGGYFRQRHFPLVRLRNERVSFTRVVLLILKPNMRKGCNEYAAGNWTAFKSGKSNEQSCSLSYCDTTKSANKASIRQSGLDVSRFCRFVDAMNVVRYLLCREQEHTRKSQWVTTKVAIVYAGYREAISQ